MGKTSFYENKKRIFKILGFGIYSISSTKLKAACHCHGITHCLLCHGLCFYKVSLGVLVCFKLLHLNLRATGSSSTFSFLGPNPSSSSEDSSSSSEGGGVASSLYCTVCKVGVVSFKLYLFGRAPFP